MVVTDVECIEPTSTDINTEFTCTGTGPDGVARHVGCRDHRGAHALTVGLPAAPGPASSGAPTTGATTVPS